MDRSFLRSSCTKWLREWEWRHQWGHPLIQGGFLLLVFLWRRYAHLPWSGVSVALIAVLAAVMSIYPDMRPRYKFVYLFLMAALLVTEFRAMRKDRIEESQLQDERLMAMLNGEQQATKTMLDGEKQGTKRIIEEENQKFDAVLKQDQKEFAQTLQTILSTHAQDEVHFGNVVKQEEDLFAEQQTLSEQFAGRMVPADKPTPENSCGRAMSRLFPRLPKIPESGITVLYGDNNAVQVVSLPYTIVEIGDTPVVSASRIKEGSNEVYLSIDFRDSSGKVAVRVDNNGVLNPSGDLFVLRPDKSTVLIDDAFGREVFRANYLNPHAFQISGELRYCGKSISLLQQRLHGTCVGAVGGTAIYIPAPPCP